MARKKTKRPLTLKAVLPRAHPRHQDLEHPTRAPELEGICRQLAALALAELEQRSPLGVRQNEQLRRALATAGDATTLSPLSGTFNYGWDSFSDAPGGWVGRQRRRTTMIPSP